MKDHYEDIRAMYKMAPQAARVGLFPVNKLSNWRTPPPYAASRAVQSR